MASGGDGTSAGHRGQRCGVASDGTNGISRRPRAIVVANGWSGVHSAAEHANAHTARHIGVSVDLGGVGMVGNRPKEETGLTFFLHRIRWRTKEIVGGHFDVYISKSVTEN
jgi:hypothetical protein